MFALAVVVLLFSSQALGRKDSKADADKCDTLKEKLKSKPKGRQNKKYRVKRKFSVKGVNSNSGFSGRPNSNYEIDPFIVGGTPAAEGQFPFVAFLRGDNGSFSCGGALVTNKHVVTAAHCIDRISANQVQVGVGSIKLDNQSLNPVEKLIIHENYDPDSDKNDIGILVLKSPLKLDKLVQTIMYPTNDDLENKPATALGWGRIATNGPTSNTLLYLTKTIINSEGCGKRLHTSIGPGQICLGSESKSGMCFGDSGGPLIYKGSDGKNYFAGIVSWGVPCAKGYPDVFTRVSYYAKWINQNTK